MQKKLQIMQKMTISTLLFSTNTNKMNKLCGFLCSKLERTTMISAFFFVKMQ